MKRKIKISVVIPNYNRKNDILETLSSIYSQEFDKYEVIVVDDNSSDNSVDAIIKKYPDVKVISLNKNNGPAIARNIGIRRAKGKIIVGIDSDATIKDKNSLKKIYSKFSENNRIYGLSFRIINYYNGEDDVGRWWHPLSIDDNVNKEFITDYFSGTGYAIKKKAMLKAGLFPEEYFMHFEECDLVLRMLDKGYDILYYPSIIVLHKVEQRSRISKIPFYYKRRNQLWMVIKYYPFFKGVIYMFPRIVLTFFLSLRAKKTHEFLKSLSDGIKEIPNELKLRQPLKSETWKKIKLIKQGKYFLN